MGRNYTPEAQGPTGPTGPSAVAVADGTYTMGFGAVTDGTITISGGIITAIQEATN